MKIRLSFVSNSSSSSFIINKKKLSKRQHFLIYNHLFFADKYEDLFRGFTVRGWDEWEIKETNDELLLSTMMDNFDMKQFLKNINVVDGVRLDYDGGEYVNSVWKGIT